MAHRKGKAGKPAAIVTKRTIRKTIEPTEVLDPDLISEPDALSPELAAALSQISEGGNVVLLKRQGDTHKFAWLKRVPAIEFSFDAIGELHGGGDYLLKFYDDDGQLVKTALHSVDPSVQGRLQPKALPEASDLTGVLAIMQGQMAAQTERFEKLLQAVIPSKTQLLEELKMYKEIFGASVPTQPIPSEVMVQMFRAGIDLVRDAKPERDDASTTFMGLAEKIATQLAERMLLRPSGAPAAPTTPSLPAPSPVAAAPASEPPNGNAGPKPEDDPMWMVKQYVKGHLPSLIYQAKRQSNPALYADVMVDNCPPKFYEQALDYLKRPGLVEELIALNGEIAGVRPWFEELQRQLVAQLEEAVAPVPGADDAPERAGAAG